MKIGEEVIKSKKLSTCTFRFAIGRDESLSLVSLFLSIIGPGMWALVT